MIQYKLGLFYQNRAQWNDAIEAYFKAVELDPNNQYAHFNLGYIHTELDLFELARDHFTNAIRANDRYEQAYYGRAYALESLGQLDRAKLDYETALNINYEYEPAKEGLGRVSKILQETGNQR
jgi:tetratricopeptide (TPR) repeat protein